MFKKITRTPPQPTLHPHPSSEGGYAQFYNIIDNPNIGFKEFKNIDKAQESYNKQKLLSSLDLAPLVYGDICQLPLATNEPSGWGYLTEIATVCNKTHCKPYTFSAIQLLVDRIYQYTKLKFWDCHCCNLGVVRRNNYHKLVCVDTGKESFDGYANAWGMNTPGPKCGYCNQYQCRCSEV